MSKDEKTLRDNCSTKHHEDEIEIMDYIQVVWKWRYLILAGFVLCALLTTIIVLNTATPPDIYRIEMVIEPPGVSDMTNLGKTVPIDTADNITAMIETGVFNEEVMSMARKNGEEISKSDLKFKGSILSRTEFVHISFEASQAEGGIKILGYLTEAIKMKYADRIDFLTKMHETQIQNEIAVLVGKEIFETTNIDLLQQRITELRSEITSLAKDTELFSAKKDSVLRNSDRQLELLPYAFSQFVEKRIDLKNKYKSEIVEYLQLIEESKLKLKNYKLSKEMLSMKSSDYEKRKKPYNNIRVIQTSNATKLHVQETNRAFTIVVASIAGLIAMVFLAFFLEYLRKCRITGDRKNDL
jgi:capsular polysaccharide biosynthesis protein